MAAQSGSPEKRKVRRERLRRGLGRKLLPVVFPSRAEAPGERNRPGEKVLQRNELGVGPPGEPLGTGVVEGKMGI